MGKSRAVLAVLVALLAVSCSSGPQYSARQACKDFLRWSAAVDASTSTPTINGVHYLFVARREAPPGALRRDLFALYKYDLEANVFKNRPGILVGAGGWGDVLAYRFIVKTDCATVR